jgi:protoporphyrinogen oxidase
MSPSRVLILGAGPAGLGAAFQLTRLKRARATVLDRNCFVGGLASSFELGGLHVDFGSHRLHPACDPDILRDIQNLLGDDLLDRPRHGRIRLRGRWIHFPLKPLDLVLKLPLGFSFGIGMDMAKKAWPFHHRNGHDTFAATLYKGLGKTICRDFYFPYAHKIWGESPEKLSATQAKRRVKANSITKIFSKVMSAVPGLKPKGAGRFYYPRQGFGQIARHFFTAAANQGAEFLLNASVEAVSQVPVGGWEVRYRSDQNTMTVRGDHVWSTLPITMLAEMINPAAPPEVLRAARSIRFRSMILIYLVLGQPRFSEYDAHYFPERDIPITRMSEPRNYSTAEQPADRTVLCAELPCFKDDTYWKMRDDDLGKLVQDALTRLSIPITGPVLQVQTRRLPQAYPIYDRGYEEHFAALDSWLNGLPNLLTLGRQGLFAHDNTHHTLAMAYAAVASLDEEGRFDLQQWQRHRKIFETHVVED